MKSIVIFFLLISSALFSQKEQSYGEYYEAVNQAEWLNFQGLYNDSFGKYLTAFSFNFPYLKDIENALSVYDSLAIDTFYHEKGDLLIFKDNFFSLDLYTKNNLSDSLKEQLIKKYTYLQKSDFTAPNENDIKLTNQLNSLFYLDQFVRTSNTGFCRDTFFAIIDSHNYNELERMIKKHGFPSRKKFGDKYIVYISAILMHGTFNTGISEELKTLLKDQITCGNFHPTWYAVLIDRYQLWALNQPKIYGVFPKRNDLGDIQNIKFVDERRKKIHLESLYEYCLKNQIILPKEYKLER